MPFPRVPFADSWPEASPACPSATGAECRRPPVIVVAAGGCSPRGEVSLHDRGHVLDGSALKVWFPDGPDTPGLTLIKVHADSAQYWEGLSSTIGKVAGGIRALVTRSPEKDPFNHRTFDL